MKMAERLIDAELWAESIQKEFCDGCDNYGGVRCSCCKVEDILVALEEAPNIEAKPVVHAHWIEKWTEESGHELICSNCGEYALMNGEFYSDASKYCPYCGVTMDEPILSREDVCRIEKEMEEAGVKTIKIGKVNFEESD